jgi:hypothetical protein
VAQRIFDSSHQSVPWVNWSWYPTMVPAPQYHPLAAFGVCACRWPFACACLGTIVSEGVAKRSSVTQPNLAATPVHERTTTAPRDPRSRLAKTLANRSMKPLSCCTMFLSLERVHRESALTLRCSHNERERNENFVTTLRER